MQLASFVFLTTSISVLLYFIRKQAVEYNMSSNLDRNDSNKSWKKETTTLLFVLIFFDLTYVVRGAVDFFIASIYTNTDLTVAISILGGAFFDLLPIVFIMSLHRHNFKQLNQRNTLQDSNMSTLA